MAAKAFENRRKLDKFVQFLNAYSYSKTGLICLVFKWSTSLDRFIKKRVIKIIFFIINWSRLAPFKNWTNLPDFEWSGFEMPGSS